MAGTITVNVSVQHVNGVLKVPFAPGPVTIVQTTQAVYSAVVPVAITDTTLTFTGITTEGWAEFYNLDATNYVQWGPNSAGLVAIGRMKPADPPASFRLDSTATVIMKANTAPCNVLIVVYAE